MYKVTRLPEANFNKKMNRAIPKTAKRLKKEWYLLKSFEKIKLPIIPIPPKTVKALLPDLNKAQYSCRLNSDR